MNMTLFQTASGVIAIAASAVTLFCLMKPRFSIRRTILTALCVLLPVSAFTIWFYLIFGVALGAKFCLLIFFLPVFLIFFYLSQYRDGRCLFVYGFNSTIAVELIFLTNFLDYLSKYPSHITMFILRLLLFPLYAWLAVRFFRRPLLKLQENIDSGWRSFSLIPLSLLFLLLLAYQFPTPVTERVDGRPAALFLMLCIPLIFYQTISSLFRQLELFESREQQSLLSIQAASLKHQLLQEEANRERISIERHDVRHRIHTACSMLSIGQVEEALACLDASDKSLSKPQGKNWCANPVLNAVFSYYLSIAEDCDIRIDATLRLEKELTFDEMDLSIVVANLLENAIYAVKMLPPKDRIIRIRCTDYPQLILKISNPCVGTIPFDADGFPVTREAGHGLGVRSVFAYSKKHGAKCAMRVSDGWFIASFFLPIQN